MISELRWKAVMVMGCALLSCLREVFNPYELSSVLRSRGTGADNVDLLLFSIDEPATVTLFPLLLPFLLTQCLSLLLACMW